MDEVRPFVSYLLTALLGTSMVVCLSCKDATTVNDVTGLNSVKVSDIVRPTSEREIIEAVHDAKKRQLTISIGGARHSQGQQTARTNTLFLDMTGYKRIVHINAQEQTIRVQAGATWKDVQDSTAPLGLSPRVQQASNIFTIGGSLSVNIHGWDPRFRPFIDTVESFSLIDSSGQVQEVSRHNNRELFQATIGGYGLFGVVSEVTIKLCPNHVLEKNVVEIPLKDYPSYYRNNVLEHSNVELHYARPDISANTLFTTALVSTFSANSDDALKELNLPDEKNTFRNFWIFQLSRYLRIPGLFDIGKPLRWRLQKKFADVPGKTTVISRSRAMRPEIQFALLPSGFFHTDILQEYFVPFDSLLPFMDRLKKIVRTNNINLLSVTIRPIHQDKESLLPYAQFDGFAIVLYVNLLTTPGGFFSNRWGEGRARQWTKELVDAVMQLKGTFYLPYQRYATREQVHAVYPQFSKLNKLKSKYDPGDLFMNQFYSTYR